MNTPNRLHQGQAFTLIELLVVIAIISLLASLLFPAVNGAVQKAHDANCKSNLKQWATAVNLYTADYDDRLPSAQTSTGAGHVPKSMAWYDYGEKVLGFSKKMRRCNSAGPSNLRIKNFNIVTIGSDGSWTTNATQYTCNSYWMRRDDQWQTGYMGWRTYLIKEPSRALMFGDGEGSAYNGGDPTWNFRYRHGSGSAYINVAMFDGRVETWNSAETRLSPSNTIRSLSTFPNRVPPLFKVETNDMPGYSFRLIQCSSSTPS